MQKNTFERSVLSYAADLKSIIVDDKEHYVIEKFLKAEIRDEKSNFIVKWKDYEEKIWKFEKKMKKDVFDLIKKLWVKKRRKKKFKAVF